MIIYEGFYKGVKVLYLIRILNKSEITIHSPVITRKKDHFFEKENVHLSMNYNFNHFDTVYFSS